MEFDPQDQDIVELLTNLKNANGEYPEDLLAARRRNYLKRMAEVGLGVGLDMGIQNAVKDVKPPSVSPAVSTILETVLVVAIIAETSAVAYFYRDKLADFFQTVTTASRVAQVDTPPAVTTPLEIQGVTPSPVITSTNPFPSATIAASPTEIVFTSTRTPIPNVVNEDDGIVEVTQANSTANTTNSTNSTPVPNVGNGNNGDNGNHYGQTPKPDRTIEPGNGNGNNNGNDDQPPKDENGSPADDKPKPTKSK